MVLPAPRNPVMTVTGILCMVNKSRFENDERQSNWHRNGRNPRNGTVFEQRIAISEGHGSIRSVMILTGVVQYGGGSGF